MTREEEIGALAMRMLEADLAKPESFWPVSAEEANRNWNGAKQAATLIIQARDASRTPAPIEQPAPEIKRCYHLLELANALESDAELGWPGLIALVQRMRKELKKAQQAPALPTDRIALAEKIAATLFNDMYGTRVDRLVLTYDGPHREMGGLCFKAALDRVLEVLNAEKSQPALPADRMGWLELWVMCEHALGLCGRFHSDQVLRQPYRLLIPSGHNAPVEVPTLTRAELTRLQSLAAELIAGDAKDGRDGS